MIDLTSSGRYTVEYGIAYWRSQMRLL